MEWLTKVAKHHNEWVKMVNQFGEYFFAEDIVQETYIMLYKWSSEEKLFKDGNISKGYMWLALKNTCLYFNFKKLKYNKLKQLQSYDQNLKKINSKIRIFKKTSKKLNSAFKKYIYNK